MSIVLGMSEARAPAPRPAGLTVPDPAGLYRARAQHQTVRRWLPALGPVLIAVIVAATASGHPGLGIHGRGLAVSIAVAGIAAGLVGGVFRVTRSASRAGIVFFSAILLAGSVALMWAQPAGPGAETALLAVISIARLLPSRVAFAVSAAAVAVLATIVAITSHGHGPGVGVLAALAGLIGMFVLAGRLGQANEQAERLLAELEASRAAEAEAAGLAERQRVAREMHDVLAHSLSGLLLKLEGARMLAAREPGDPRIGATVVEAHRLAMSGLEEAHQAIGALRGDQMPGPDRLPELAARFGQERGIPCQLTVSGAEQRLGTDTHLAVYRVAQEALTNIARHARPDHVEVRLTYLPDVTCLAIEDFAACDAEAAAPPAFTEGGGYGLTGMRERAEILGGTLRAGPTRTGFLVELEVPA
ncbi:MAG: sensor histidine kinase [Streptosporangiaceae bacterium]